MEVRLTKSGNISTRGMARAWSDGWGYVYFVRATTLGLVKIGCTIDARDRLKTLQVGSPDRLELLGVICNKRWEETEREVHRRFAAHRRHGEWFEPCDKLLAYIAKNATDLATADAKRFAGQRDKLSAALS